ncbi:glycerol-3-phosphate responsive antiterminator [Fictibacillus enclensis]|uniref:glycerol-3-phosphate responsive antiterminator n=1 Tax=Fictibacillus enclensis TaxID=1017270 RepID=UPI0024C0A7B1|nr:glycerol-3-phosphate responsive antiterminator [Fictibacillus enclensis]WHY71950.1 glycerol-3-phosphate responsive antiterminator [Fictibacillus enclensis]
MSTSFILENTVIPSVRDLKQLRIALKSVSPIILLSETHIGNLQSLTRKCHESNKKVIVHLDLVGGLNKDPIGLKMLRDLFKVDGIISPNVKIINQAKDLGLFSIHRLFLLDSRSLETGLKSTNGSQLDAIEVLPGPFAKHFIEQIKTFKKAPVLAGGFISTKEDVAELFNAGFHGITTSSSDLWKTK